jgi:tRNA(Glu) U13 pseudouridine synthase TruD
VKCKHFDLVLSSQKRSSALATTHDICKKKIKQVLVKGKQGEVPQTTFTHHARTIYLKLISNEHFQVYRSLQRIINLMEKHVSVRGCKHYHCLTFQLVVAYTEKQLEAKDTGFNHPLRCSSSSKNANGSSIDIMMW